MPGIVGMADTFNCPNYIGELYLAGKVDAPFLSAIGGLTGGISTIAKRFTWEGYDLRPSSSTRQRLEGATAPTATARARYVAHNVVEIHQEAVSVSYTKLAAIGQIDLGVLQEGTNPVRDEEAWQIAQLLKEKALDINDTFINGVFAEPADNLTARKTRGLLDAIATNIWDAHGDPLTADMVVSLMQMTWENGGIREGETRTAIGGAAVMRRLNDLFVPANVVRTQTTVGGVNLQTIETPFGNLNLMKDPAVPKGTLIVCSLGECAPVHLLVPSKGFMFVEPLAKTGSSNDSQLYGEVGLKYGQESMHGKIVDFTTPWDTISGSGS
jgi:hypothetical protein